MTKTVTMPELLELPHPDGEWPWTLIGVFPTIEHVKRDPDALHRQFMYTVGAGDTDLWFDGLSIEYRGLTLDTFFGFLANTLTSAFLQGAIAPGDSVEILLGVPGADGKWDHDAPSYWWIGEPTTDHARYETYQSTAAQIVPVKWSSPLGWRDD